MTRLCFVCSGNICRSPSAEIVMRELLRAEGLDDDVEVSSAGLGDWHVGEGADPRSADALTTRGYDASRHRARQFDAEWFADHDLVVAMDRSHWRDLRRLATEDEADKVVMLMSFAGEDADVPDPYYGGPAGFTDVLEQIERGCRGLLEDLRAEPRT
jgi:protein-tyrosine phosphatase